MALQAGDVLGQYTITRQVGSGGMATVYQAYHEKLDRHVAIKVMHDTFVQDDNFLERFQREARIVARLEHPHIVSVYDYAESDGQPYLVMQFVEGGTLKRRFIKYGMTLQDIRKMMTALADALTYAHEKGVLHRDIKPSNVLIDDRDMPYITDFGLARIAQVGESTISHDMMLGTPFYISPEQARGEKNLGATTDIYSFGIILYELLVGTVPFTADTPYAIVHNHIYNKPTPPSHVNPELTSAIDDVIMKALAKNPADRFQTATELMQAFNQAIETSGVTELPPDRSSIQNRSDMMPVDSTEQAAVPAPINHQRQPPYIAPEISEQSPQARYTTDSKGRRVRVEGALDMGNFSFNDLGQRIDRTIRTGVDYVSELADQIESKAKAPEPTPEEQIRRRVEQKLHARREIFQHLVVYMVINVGLWFLFLSSSGAFDVLSGTPISEISLGFPWPLFPTIFWGMGVVMQYIEYYYKHGGGADRREAEIEAEITRQMRISQMRNAERRKGTYDPEEETADYEIFDIDNIEARQVRLNEDGELTDSFIQENEPNQRRARR